MAKRKPLLFFCIIAIAAILLTACLNREEPLPGTDTEPVSRDDIDVTDTSMSSDTVPETFDDDETEADTMAETSADTKRYSLSAGEYESGEYIIDPYAGGDIIIKNGNETRVIEMTRPATEPPTEPPYVPATEPETKYVPETEDTFKPVKPLPPSSGKYAPSVLMYHLILENPTTSLTSLFVRPSDFDAHIAMLKEEGYEFLFADEYTYTSSKSVIITLDDGYVDNYTEMFPILKKYGVKATIFVIAGKIGWNGYLTSEQIKEMSDSGLVSIQSHTMWHQSLTGLSDAGMREEFRESAAILEGITGRPVTSIAYPAGNYNSRVISAAKDYFSCAYTTVSSGTTKGYGVMELPRIRVNRGLSAAGLKSLLR